MKEVHVSAMEEGEKRLLSSRGNQFGIFSTSRSHFLSLSGFISTSPALFESPRPPSPSTPSRTLTQIDGWHPFQTYRRKDGEGGKEGRSSKEPLSTSQEGERERERARCGGMAGVCSDATKQDFPVLAKHECSPSEIH